ncbi:2-C-methyl-D-erythritol 4-phosphate cytidylyltransferase [Clostridium tagluense]|uniref:2-C-methyl-D-erythritol 4-phosphate cytidylyltransferase n=1 Tax=Clostridium tagluense TaxID=360422 RepID=UPI001C0BFBD7|nr:2-C-methyl-D-erythritol 4-phosphate cytidylyltransferase [Clostridium tagluense]MBU3128598.1 2-C-methyl-D-erythritol 4-phosphate cytidylyltransferase [Clostridium tagluense]MCB2300876.1 2-C-methyl-D-erythritol 4-phosphate cytidylyltransferase [Clostridium tagluense]MCB2313278.1 2-C-methyl-D-erythritol 4-phosphate cytidylyltransferase [Clostridium tagluense]MCB2318044.1 2-C-methyl-D-erythritol 4-phosphate cytidylyltransferase [Clostridium tagluense]MCB2322903.1 2-C-methyl-D-erythritol 4-phos
MSRNCAIILAAGKGTRMGQSINKQYLKINKHPILYYTLKAFTQCDCIDEIIVVVAEGEMDYCREEIINKYNFFKVKAVIVGGAQRQDSVLNGLKALRNCEIVLIHDGARPFINESIIKNAILYANLYGATACGVKPKDTIKIVDASGFSIKTPDREMLFCVQTPQAFKYDLILKCHMKISEEDIRVTDDTMVVERYGNRVYLYEGSYNNIKITTPEDLEMGKQILEASSS